MMMMMMTMTMTMMMMMTMTCLEHEHPALWLSLSAPAAVVAHDTAHDVPIGKPVGTFLAAGGRAELKDKGGQAKTNVFFQKKKKHPRNKSAEKYTLEKRLYTLQR